MRSSFPRQSASSLRSQSTIHQIRSSDSRLDTNSKAKGASLPSDSGLKTSEAETEIPQLDPEAVRRTLWFLKAAAEERGLEHRIVKNILRVRWEEYEKKKVYHKYVHDRRVR